MRTQLQQQTITFLQKLGEKGSVPPQACFGICQNVFIAVGEHLINVFPEYTKIKENWRYYSGSYVSPVPVNKYSANDAYSSMDAYWDTSFNKWSGTYGDMRRMFACYLANEFSKLYPE